MVVIIFVSKINKIFFLSMFMFLFMGWERKEMTPKKMKPNIFITNFKHKNVLSNNKNIVWQGLNQIESKHLWN